MKCPMFPNCDTAYADPKDDPPIGIALPDHECPFQVELNDDYTTCNCCNACTHGCAMDI